MVEPEAPRVLSRIIAGGACAWTTVTYGCYMPQHQGLAMSGDTLDGLAVADEGDVVLRSKCQKTWKIVCVDELVPNKGGRVAVSQCSVVTVSVQVRLCPLLIRRDRCSTRA
jgi:hypothetical protein